MTTIKHHFFKDSVDDVEVDVEIGNKENEEIECNNEDGDVEEGEIDQEEVMNDTKEEETEARGSQWKISKVVDNRTTYIHIKQALKLILPREYIACYRQKQHWAAKYLPGKAPVDAKHDIVKFSNVALKCLQQGEKVFDIARVEGIQSSKDGSECRSFKLKGDTMMRCRFLFYQRSSTDDTYHLHPSLGLTNWKPSSSILGAVKLIPVEEGTKVKEENTESRNSPPSKKGKKEARVKNKEVSKISKGKMYRSSLPCSNNNSNEKSQTKKVPKMATNASASGGSCDNTSVISVEENSKEEVQKDMGVLADVLRRHDNFMYSRQMLDEATFPGVDITLVNYSTNGSSSNLHKFQFMTISIKREFES
ncbi:hypothetical protein ACROYT_G014918 [Oculina patagonica]